MSTEKTRFRYVGELNGLVNFYNGQQISKKKTVVLDDESLIEKARNNPDFEEVKEGDK